MRGRSWAWSARLAVAALLAAWVAPSLAEAEAPPRGTYYEYNGTPNPLVRTVVSNRSSTVICGKRGVSAVASTMIPTAWGYGVASGYSTDYCASVQDENRAVIELHAEKKRGWTYWWAADARVRWLGKANATAYEGGDAKIDLGTILKLDGDIALAADCSVSASDESGLSFSWSAKDGAGVDYKVAKSSAVDQTEVQGNDQKTGSGQGAAVRIDVLSAAHASLQLQTPTAVGVAAAAGEAEIRGAVDLTIFAMAPAYPQTPGGEQLGGPTTGGPPPADVVTPSDGEVVTIRVRRESLRIEPEKARVELRPPEEPKTFPR